MVTVFASMKVEQWDERVRGSAKLGKRNFDRLLPCVGWWHPWS